MRKILILFPKNIKKGQPSFERVNAFYEFFITNNILVHKYETPLTLHDKVKLYKYLRKNNIRNIFISMPQFSNWWIFILSNINILFDIRDGWSIAMKSGYGGIVKPRIIKSLLATFIEKFCINRSVQTITCTPGLQSYLKKISKKNILLILNGYSKNDEVFVLKLKRKKNKNPNVIVAICVGKFSEYGRDKAKLVIKKLSKDYFDKNVILKLVGCNLVQNLWIRCFITESKIKNIHIEFINRLSRREMYQEIISSDIGVTIIRDPDYDFGTKVYDYILCGLPILNYFGEKNNFIEYFENKLDKDHCFERNSQILKESSSILNHLI